MVATGQNRLVLENRGPSGRRYDVSKLERKVGGVNRRKNSVVLREWKNKGLQRKGWEKGKDRKRREAQKRTEKGACFASRFIGGQVKKTQHRREIEKGKARSQRKNTRNQKGFRRRGDSAQGQMFPSRSQVQLWCVPKI